jgi:hypothetical protein
VLIYQHVIIFRLTVAVGYVSFMVGIITIQVEGLDLFLAFAGEETGQKTLCLFCG